MEDEREGPAGHAVHREGREVMDREYLGDGVYIEHDPAGQGVVIFTSNGITDTNRIFLEDEVLVRLLRFVEGKVTGSPQGGVLTP